VKAIAIATTPDSKSLGNLMKSMSGYDKYQILILSDFNYELGKIKFIYDHTNIEEFILLHDSCEVKDTSFIEDVFNNPLSVSFSCSPNNFGSYLGKYQRSVLSKMDIPIAKSKLDSVNYEETFNLEYEFRAGKIGFLSPQLVNTTKFEEMFGKMTMILENDYLIKYKSCWNRMKLS
jgi:hypothetical protein